MASSTSGTLTLRDSTVGGNSAGFDGGGIFNSGTFSRAGTVTLANSTVSSNTATEGSGGISNRYIRWRNIASQHHPSRKHGVPDAAETVVATLTSLGHNLVGSTAGCGFTPATGDVVNVNAMLGPLADNGGPTFTHALLPGSPAIDAGDDEACPDIDQRGVARPRGAACDIGAFEDVPPLPKEVPDLPTCNMRDATIVATDGDDFLIGTSGADVIVGLDGNDIILGLGGDDTICAGAGNDWVRGGSGNDTIFGEAGRDKLIGGGGRDRLLGGPGKDLLKGLGR